MLFLSIVAQYNKPNKPKNHTSTSVYYLFFVKWNFVFTLRNSGPAKTGPAGPIPTPLFDISSGSPLHTSSEL